MTSSQPSSEPVDPAAHRSDKNRPLRQIWPMLAVLIVLLACTLTITENAGVTNLATILRLRAGGPETTADATRPDDHPVVANPARAMEVAATSSSDASAKANHRSPPAVPKAESERTVAELEKAVEAGERALSTRPDDPDAQCGLAQALAELAAAFRSQKRYSAARPLLERAVRLHTGVWKVHPQREDLRKSLAVELSTLAETFLQLGNYTDAARIADEMPRTFPGDWQACQQGARLLLHCAGLVTRDGQMSETDRTELGRSYLHSARRLLQEAVRRGSSAVSGALEAETLEIVEFHGCTPWPQMMSAWGLERWSNGFQLWCPAQQQGFVVFEIAVRESGRYGLGVFLTKGPACGIVEVALDDVPVGESVDGFAPAVSPSGRVEIGELNLTPGKHRLRFLVADRNTQSAGYSLGIDCLTLTPIAE